MTKFGNVLATAFERIFWNSH